MTQHELLTTREAAALLRVSPSLLQRDRGRRDDLPPFVKVGARIFYRRADLDAWLQQQVSP